MAAAQKALVSSTCVMSDFSGWQEAAHLSCYACRVFVNTMLSGTQQRNLEAAWHTPVIDRIALIIAIFSKRAKSREAKLQVGTAHSQDLNRSSK